MFSGFGTRVFMSRKKRIVFLGGEVVLWSVGCQVADVSAHPSVRLVLRGFQKGLCAAIPVVKCARAMMGAVLGSANGSLFFPAI